MQTKDVGGWDEAKLARFIKHFIRQSKYKLVMDHADGGDVPIKLNYVIVEFDPPALAANTNAAWLIDLPPGSANIGDLVIASQPEGLPSGLVESTGTRVDIVITEDQIRYRVRNVSGSTINAGATNWHIVIINLL